MKRNVLKEGPVTLSIKERITLIGILPKKGNADTVKMSAVLNVGLALKKDEAEAIDFKIQVPQATWDPDKEAQMEAKTFPLSRDAVRFIVGILDEMNKSKALKFEHLPLWMRFCESK